MNANEEQTFSLPAGQRLSVVAASGASGSAIRMARVPGGGDAQSITALTTGATFTFGPYADPERFKIICAAGTLTVSMAVPDPALSSSDVEVAAALAALLATALSGSDATHVPTVKAVFDALALKAPLASPTFTGALTIAGTVGLPEKTPVNATCTTLTIPAADNAVISADDTVAFLESTFTKVGSNPGAGEFTDAAGLAALIGALDGWDAEASESTITATSHALGIAQNGQIATITHKAITTSGGSEAAEAAAKFGAASIAQLAVGDQVTFDGETFTKAAATSVPAGEFADVAGLILCIDGMEDWTAVLNGSDIDIEAAAVGAAFNDKVLNCIYKRTSAGAVAGTVGVAHEMCADTGFIYHCVGANNVHQANWRRIARGTAY